MSNSSELVYRLISGRQRIVLGGNEFEICAPTIEDMVKSTEIFRETVKKYRFERWFSDTDCLILLVKNGLCSKEIDQNLKEIEKEVENAKVDLYKALYAAELQSQRRKRLNLIRDKQSEMITSRHCLDHLTLNGFAEMVRRQYLMYCTAYYTNGQKVWNDFEKVDVLLLESMTGAVLNHSLSQSQIRKIARTEPWKSFWSIRKVDVFEGKVYELTEEQRSLLLYSRMYDSIYEHPDCPSDKVLEDDDMLDGWLIIEHRKREKERTTKEIENRMEGVSNKLANSGEIGIIASGKTEEEKLQHVKEINELNDLNTRMIRKNRAAMLKAKGKALDTDFADVQRELQAEVNKQFMQVKGKNK